MTDLVCVIVYFGVLATMDVCGSIGVSTSVWPTFCVITALATINVRGGLMCLDTCTRLGVCAVSVPFGVLAAIDVCGCVDVSRCA